MGKAPIIGQHLAGLNLFREPDGTVEITVTDSRGAITEMTPLERGEMRPVYYVEGLIIEAADRMRSRRPAVEAPPIPMVLHCPRCGTQHIDEATPEWDNPPHRSHACQKCGCIWRPADVATVGVATITTRGRADNWEPGAVGKAGGFCPECGAANYGGPREVRR